MSVKSLLIALGVHSFPPKWRKEYGDELAYVLECDRFGCAAFANVVCCGLVQRARAAHAQPHATALRALVLLAALLIAPALNSGTYEWGAWLLGLNLLTWNAFISLLARREWTPVGMAIGLLHMMLATPATVGPIRALSDERFHIQIGMLGASGMAGALVAVLFLSWCLLSARCAVVAPSRPALAALAVGDGLMALNLVAAAALGFFSNATSTIQAGELFAVKDRLAATVVLVGGLAAPFSAAAFWALKVHGTLGVVPGTGSDSSPTHT